MQPWYFRKPEMEKLITAYTYIGEGKVFANKRLIFYQEKKYLD